MNPLDLDRLERAFEDASAYARQTDSAVDDLRVALGRLRHIRGPGAALSLAISVVADECARAERENASAIDAYNAAGAALSAAHEVADRIASGRV